jgi:hypothetical protein
MQGCDVLLMVSESVSRRVDVLRNSSVRAKKSQVSVIWKTKNSCWNC